MKKKFIFAHDPKTPPPGLENPVIAIGNFDGLHRGHHAVIARAQKCAREMGRPCALLTFEPHPVAFFKGSQALFRLTGEADKAREAERLGLDGLIILPFDADFAQMTAQAFCEEILTRRLAVSAVVVGYDFHFGANRLGTPKFLSDYGALNGIFVEIVDKVSKDDSGSLEAVSSSAIRHALAAGDVALAKQWLGRPWSVAAPIIGGRKVGRAIGFPTINLALDPSCKLRHGVYGVRARIGELFLKGAASFGSRPTFDDGPPLLEVYLLDFSGDLYGEKAEIFFHAFLRPELKFASVDALIEQMREDVNKINAMQL